jgi:hypothetical protein
MLLKGKYAFQFKGMYFEVDPTTGGRISSFNLTGKESLFLDTVKKNNNWGATFWPAPQSKWGWPPSDTLDSKPYTAEIKGTHLVLHSAPTKAKPNCAFTKIFEVSEIDTSVIVTYGITNTDNKEAKWSAWQIARVPSGGLSFFPSGETPLTGDLAPLMTQVNGITWFQYDSTKIPTGVPKLFSDGHDGWLAHVDDNGLLIIFKFKDTPPSLKAEGEDEIEFYAHPDLSYVELEPLGPAISIPAQGTSEWSVKWYIRQLPTYVTSKVGSESLIQYVRSVIKIRPSLHHEK